MRRSIDEVIAAIRDTRPDKEVGKFSVQFGTFYIKKIEF